MKSHSRRGACGTTLVEMMVVCAILGPLLLAVLSGSAAVSRSLSTNVTQSTAIDRSRRACRQLAQLVQAASLTSLRVQSGPNWVVPVAGVAYSTLRFRPLDRLGAAWGMVLEPARTFTFARDRTETANGRDDDQDGLVDEGSIEATHRDGSRRVLVSGVERVQYSVSGRVLTISVQAGLRDSTHRTHRATSQISISLRNN
jgi:hypothetical protein